MELSGSLLRDGRGKRGFVREQLTVTADLEGGARVLEKVPEQHLIDDRTGRPIAASSDATAPAARNPFPLMKTASASSLTFRDVHSNTSQVSISCGSNERPADDDEMTSNPPPSK